MQRFRRAFVATSLITLGILTGCGGSDGESTGSAGSDASEVRSKLIAGITETGDVSQEQAECIADKAVAAFDRATLDVLVSDVSEASPELLDEKAGAGTSDKLIEISTGCILGDGATTESSAAEDEAATGETEAAETETAVTEAAVTTEAPVATEPLAPAGPGSSLDQSAPLGTAVDVGGGWTFGLANYQPEAGSAVATENEYNEAAPAGQQYAMIEVTATYNGPDDKASVFLAPTLKAVGPTKKSYDQYDCSAVLPNQLDVAADVFAGASITGNVCFVVDAADAAGLTVYTTGFDDDFNELLVYFATA